MFLGATADQLQILLTAKAINMHVVKQSHADIKAYLVTLKEIRSVEGASGGIGGSKSALGQLEQSGRRIGTTWTYLGNVFRGVFAPLMSLAVPLKAIGGLVSSVFGIFRTLVGATIRVVGQLAHTLLNVLGSALTTVRNLALGVTAAIVGIGIWVARGGIEFNSLRQTATLAFESMLGSGEKAKKMLSSLFQLAMETTFTIPQSIEAAQKLLVAEFDPAQVIPMLKRMNAFLIAMGNEPQLLERSILGITQVKMKERLQGPELKQLTEARLPIYDALRKMGMRPGQALMIMERQGAPRDVPMLQSDLGDLESRIGIQQQRIAEGGETGSKATQMARERQLNKLLAERAEILQAIAEGGEIIDLNAIDVLESLFLVMDKKYGHIAKNATTLWVVQEQIIQDQMTMAKGFLTEGMFAKLVPSLTRLTDFLQRLGLTFKDGNTQAQGLAAVLLGPEGLGAAWDWLGTKIEKSEKILEGFIKKAAEQAADGTLKGWIVSVTDKLDTFAGWLREKIPEAWIFFQKAAHTAIVGTIQLFNGLQAAWKLLTTGLEDQSPWQQLMTLAERFAATVIEAIGRIIIAFGQLIIVLADVALAFFILGAIKDVISAGTPWAKVGVAILDLIGGVVVASMTDRIKKLGVGLKGGSQPSQTRLGERERIHGIGPDLLDYAKEIREEGFGGATWGGEGGTAVDTVLAGARLGRPSLWDAFMTGADKGNAEAAYNAFFSAPFQQQAPRPGVSIPVSVTINGGINNKEGVRKVATEVSDELVRKLMPVFDAVSSGDY